MVKDTKIEWADHTFNPWEGCQKVGPGCDNCYAEARDQRFTGGIHWGPGSERRRTSPANWRQPIKWNADAAKARRRDFVFCASLADVFDNAVPPLWRKDLIDLIRSTPDLVWLLLTKRVGNVEALADAASGVNLGWPRNAWLGATIVNQEEADRDIPKLLSTKAEFRIPRVFLSCEPLLGPVDLSEIDLDGHRSIFPLSGTNGCEDEDGHSAPDVPAIDWVIAGGESGPKARPMHPDWARGLRDQCAAADVPFLFKQWGEWAPGSMFPESIPSGEYNDLGKPTDYPEEHAVWLVGKKVAGRLLDGLEHNGRPEA